MERWRSVSISIHMPMRCTYSEQRWYTHTLLVVHKVSHVTLTCLGCLIESLYKHTHANEVYIQSVNIMVHIGCTLYVRYHTIYCVKHADRQGDLLLCNVHIYTQYVYMCMYGIWQ